MLAPVCEPSITICIHRMFAYLLEALYSAQCYAVLKDEGVLARVFAELVKVAHAINAAAAH